MSYVTSEQVCNILAWDLDSPDDQSTVELFIPIAEDMIEQYCQCSFATEEGTTKTFDGKGGEYLWTRHFLRSASAVGTYDGVGNLTGSIMTAVLWPDNPTKGLYRGLQGVGSYVFPEGTRNIAVTGDWGFADGEVPKAFQAAVAFTVKHLADRRLIDENVSKESGGGRYVEFRSLEEAGMYIPRFARDLLAPYYMSRRFDF